MRTCLILMAGLWTAGAPAMVMGQVCVIVGQDAPALEQQAGDELAGYVTRLFKVPVKVVRTGALQAGWPDQAAVLLVGSPATNPLVAAAVGADWPAVSDQGFVLRRARFAGGDGMIVGGDSAVATLWAVYELVERWGVRYLVDRDLFPDDPGRFALPEVNEVFEPNIRVRCWRMINDLVNGPESWGIDDCRRFIEQITKMKYNAVLLWTYPWQSFVDFSFRGVSKSTGTSWYGWEYPIHAHAVGRERFGPDDTFVNPVFRDAKTYVQRVDAGRRYVHAILDHAKRYQMRTYLGWSVRDFSSEFKARLPEWVTPYDGPAEHGDSARQLGVATVGQQRYDNVRDPAYRELCEAQLLAYMNAYPQVDSFVLGAAEFRWPVSDYRACWRELDAQYGLEQDFPLDELARHARGRQFHGEGRAHRELLGDVELLWLIDRLLKRPAIRELAGQRGCSFMVYAITEELFALLPRVLPAGSGLVTHIDYTTALAMQRIHVLEPFAGTDTPVLLVLTPQDDNVVMYHQNATGAIHQAMAKMRAYGTDGFVMRYWMPCSFDLTSDYMARASWRAELTPPQAYARLLEPSGGSGPLADVTEAMAVLEETTEPLLAGGGPSLSHYRRAAALLEAARDKAAGSGGRWFLDNLLHRVRFTERLLSRGGVDDVAGYAVTRAAVEAWAHAVRDRSDLGFLARINRDLYYPSYRRHADAAVRIEGPRLVRAGHRHRYRAAGPYAKDPEAVTWSIEPAPGATIDGGGQLTLASEARGRYVIRASVSAEHDARFLATITIQVTGAEPALTTQGLVVHLSAAAREPSSATWPDLAGGDNPGVIRTYDDRPAGSDAFAHVPADAPGGPAVELRQAWVDLTLTDALRRLTSGTLEWWISAGRPGDGWLRGSYVLIARDRFAPIARSGPGVYVAGGDDRAEIGVAWDPRGYDWLWLYNSRRGIDAVDRVSTANIGDRYAPVQPALPPRTIADDRPHHYIITVDAARDDVRFYVDGLPLHTLDMHEKRSHGLETSDHLFFADLSRVLGDRLRVGLFGMAVREGKEQLPDGWHLPGRLHAFRLYDHPLAEQQVQANALAGPAAQR